MRLRGPGPSAVGIIGVALGVMLGAAVDTVSAPVMAQPVDDAASHGKKGQALYGDGKYAEALVELKKAREQGGSYDLLYNLARAAQKLGDPGTALDSFELYLKEGGGRISGPRRNLIEQEIAKIRASIATLEIRSEPAGARVTLDGVVLEGVTPITRTTTPGRHEVALAKDGFSPASKSVEVTATQSASVSIALTAAKPVSTPASSASAAAVAVPAPMSTPTSVSSSRVRSAVTPPEPSGPTNPPWAPRPPPTFSAGIVTSWVVTTLLIAGTITTGALSLDARQERDRLRNTPGASQREIHDEGRRANTFGLVTAALGGATLVSGGLSLYLTGRVYRDAIPDYPPSIPAARSNALLVSPAGVSWVSTF